MPTMQHKKFFESFLNDMEEIENQAVNTLLGEPSNVACQVYFLNAQLSLTNNLLSLLTNEFIIFREWVTREPCDCASESEASNVGNQE